MSQVAVFNLKVLSIPKLPPLGGGLILKTIIKETSLDLIKSIKMV